MISQRLTSSIWWDIILQARNGFYLVSALIAVLFIAVLWYVPRDLLRSLLPAIILGNVLVNGFYYMAALLLLERDEGSLYSLAITPLRPGHYLFAKTVTLAVLTLLETAVVVGALFGLSVQWGWLVAAVVLNTIWFALLGVITAVRYQGVNDFLLPSVVFCSALFVPLLDYFGLVNTAVMYLHPVQAILMLWRGALGTAVGWQLAYGLLYSLLSIAFTAFWAIRALRHLWRS